MTPAEITALLTIATILDLQDAGYRAALAGAGPTECPHGPRDPADAKGRAQRLLWLRGYAAARTTLRTRG